MNITLETLAAIFRVGGHLVRLDGEIKREEVAPITDFFNTFEGMDEETMQAIVDHANNEMTDGRALDLITAMEPEDKQQIADLFAKIVCADGVVTDEEKEIYQKICSICGLPAPGDSSSAEEQQEEETVIIPAFLLVKSNGHTSIKQSENEDWNSLSKDIASWIDADRVEVVRFTKPLNALTEKLNLNGRHLVFLVDRNFLMRSDLGDNMPGTILYGSGYEILGDIVFALETDDDYQIEGIFTQSLLVEVGTEINNAVGDLLIMDK